MMTRLNYLGKLKWRMTKELAQHKKGRHRWNILAYTYYTYMSCMQFCTNEQSRQSVGIYTKMWKGYATGISFDPYALRPTALHCDEDVFVLLAGANKTINKHAESRLVRKREHNVILEVLTLAHKIILLFLLFAFFVWQWRHFDRIILILFYCLTCWLLANLLWFVILPGILLLTTQFQRKRAIYFHLNSLMCPTFYDKWLLQFLFYKFLEN